MAEAEGSHWILGLAASAQLAVGIASYRRGLRGSSDPALMPFKAFVAASLFVGAGATGCLLLLRSAGICKVDDAREAGKSLRKWLGAPEKDRNNPTASVR